MARPKRAMKRVTRNERHKSELEKFRERSFSPRKAKYDDIYLQGKNERQDFHLDSAFDPETITIAAGSAGSGKTFISVSAALKQLVDGDYERLILVRPNVSLEGENDLGALPGDLTEKLSPILKPMIDVLESYLGAEAVTKMMISGIIEVVPIQFIRGRSFEDCVLLVDEAQNLSKSGMKAVLTRGGQNCKIMITGDISQSDREYENNGLAHAVSALRDVEGIDIVKYHTEDVVRSQNTQTVLRYWDS